MVRTEIHSHAYDFACFITGQPETSGIFKPDNSGHINRALVRDCRIYVIYTRTCVPGTLVPAYTIRVPTLAFLPFLTSLVCHVSVKDP